MSLKESMVPTGTARESEYGRELPLYEVEATNVEPMFQNLYSYIFDFEGTGYSATEMNRPLPTMIFVLNFDKPCKTLMYWFFYIGQARMDPRNKDVDLDNKGAPGFPYEGKLPLLRGMLLGIKSNA
ncbi:hypothetical protein QJS10_CPB12g00503 [Acorus calamus]|uniref:Uncharacterized protein n=1 Tax=Acorus calamus TaxID=4465 RepID=A0AAV9DP89_ACOCL|nr:hypothetical protein QJS10_CPB12g00503 [Acorus calamus]